MEPDNTTLNQPGEPGTSPAPSTARRAADEAQRLVSSAQSRVRSRVEEGKSQVADSLDAVAGTLKQSGSSLRDQQQNTAGEYVERVASQIERAAGYLQRTDAADLMRGVEQFARRQPAVFIGAAFAIGVLGARFLRSSRSQMDADGGSPGAAFADREVPTARAAGAADVAPGASFDATLDASGNPT